MSQHFFLLDVCIGPYTTEIVFLPLGVLNFPPRGKPIALSASGTDKALLTADKLVHKEFPVSRSRRRWNCVLPR